jgi:fructokinase
MDAEEVDAPESTDAAVLVVGEALIDLLWDGAGETSLRPVPGGGPYNTAIALSLLGVRTAFCSKLSDDGFGRLLRDRLQGAGVDLRYVSTGSAPSPLALVGSAAGDAEYSFHLAGTSITELRADDLPALPPTVRAIHFGTLALAVDPPRTILEQFMKRQASERLIALDPNVRPPAISSRAEYRRHFDDWLTHAHVVKLSNVDAAYLYPDASVEEVLEVILRTGVHLAIVTLGADGAIGRTRRGSAHVVSPPVEVVDTVGAGDAFGAGILRHLSSAGCLAPDAVSGLGDRNIAELLAFANSVAGLQCTRAGGAASQVAELEEFQGELETL